MFTFAVLVRWVHVLALMVWAGGLFYQAFVLPQVHRAEVAPRFQRLSFEAAAVVLLTGLFNLMTVGYGRGFSYGDAYLIALGIKLLCFAGFIALQALYTYRLLPTADRRTSWVAAFALVLAATATALGLGLGAL